MVYEVRLEVFEGPFDLLLQLIARRRLEVTEIDLADITADFLAHLTDLDTVDLDTATRFLVVAATLIELKAARLLPQEHRGDAEDLLAEARDLLYARLLEYRAFRAIADELQVAFGATEHRVGRDVPLEPRFRRLVPDTTLGIGIDDLARLAARATAPPPVETVDLGHVRRATLSIRDATTALLERLARGRSSFDELADGRERHERVVFFLAALELYKLGHLDLDQPDLRGPLAVTPLEGGTDLASVTDQPLMDELDVDEHRDGVTGAVDGTGGSDVAGRTDGTTEPGATDPRGSADADRVIDLTEV